MAFITSEGVLNSAKNETIRRALMKDNNLVSAVRLPNNLFTDYAGTEVGSDLIILQKNTVKQSFTEVEELFCQSQITQYNTPSNALFQDNGRIIHTTRVLDTDPYGQPAFIYTHRDGVEGIAKDLKQMLSEDFGEHLDIGLYKGERNDVPVIEIPIIPTVTPPAAQSVTITQETQILSAPTINKVKEERQLSIFDLFENLEEPAVVVTPVKAVATTKQQAKGKRTVNGYQANLFSGLMQQPPVSTSPVNNNTSNERNTQEVIGDLFSGLNGNGLAQKITAGNTIPEPAIYTKEIQIF